MISSRIIRAGILCLVTVFAPVQSGRAEQDALLVMNDQVPPYIIVDSETGAVTGGLDIEILTHVFKRMGFNPQFTAVPYPRIPVHMAQFDGVAGMHYGKPFEPHQCVSRPYRAWNDAVISLPSRKLTPDAIKSASLTTFPGAKKYLAEELEPFMPAAERSREVRLPGLAARSLHAGRFDAYLGDFIVFRYNELEQGIENDLSEPIHWFKPLLQSLLFQDFELCDQFNQEIETFLQDPAYTALLEKYGAPNELQDRMLDALTKLIAGEIWHPSPKPKAVAQATKKSGHY